MGKTSHLPFKIPLWIALAALGFGLALGLGVHFTAAAAPDTPTENNVLICHVPPFGPMWIWVNESALDSHLDHGDFEWSADAECGGDPYPGDDECEDRSYLIDDDDDDDCDGGLHFMHLPVVRSP